MAELFVKRLPYSASSEPWFNALATYEHRAWLDSSDSARGRFDVMTANPASWDCFVPTRGLSTDQVRDDAESFLNTLRRRHKALNAEFRQEGLPFCGGIIGLLQYDFGRCLMNVSSDKPQNLNSPIAEAGFYQWAIVQDHQLKRCTFVSLEPAKQASSTLHTLRTHYAQTYAAARAALETEMQSNLNEEDYRDAFDQIREYTLAGDCYQINFSKQYSAAYDGDPAFLYRQLRDVTSGPFSAYFEGSTSTTLSLSPERLVSMKQNRLLTQPIKGTAPRSSNMETDQKNARSLQASGKNQAENLMIVDLLRNDFGKVCVPGSISVPQLFELQSFSAVHHLVSSIRGELSADKDAFDLVQALFPGGSVTGAPKRRAMEIIEELEPHNRNVYCGSVFYLSVCGRFDSNILIRSILCENGQLKCWGGGGIVLDSTEREEWDEIDDKIGNLLRVLNATRDS